MSELENLKNFINQPNETAKNATTQNTSPINRSNLDMKTEIERNSSMKSSAERLCTILARGSLALSGILLLMCFFINDSFWGSGLKWMTSLRTNSYSSSTWVANLMVRFLLLSMYFFFLEIKAYRMTCRVCGSFFPKIDIIWSKHTGTSYETQRTTTYYNDSLSHTDIKDTAYYSFDELCQCRCCSSIYTNKTTKKQTGTTRIQY